MNLKRKYKNSGTKLKSTQLKSNTQPISRSLNTEILRTVIVFLSILAFNVGYSQCTVFDLPDSTQNKIVKAFIELKEFKELSNLDNKRIIDLSISNEELNKTNNQLTTKITKARKWPYITLGIGLGAGIWLGTKLK